MYDQGYMQGYPLFLNQGLKLVLQCLRKMMTTDASLTGWAAVVEGCSDRGCVTIGTMNYLEMLAVL